MVEYAIVVARLLDLIGYNRRVIGRLEMSMTTEMEKSTYIINLTL